MAAAPSSWQQQQQQQHPRSAGHEVAGGLPAKPASRRAKAIARSRDRAIASLHTSKIASSEDAIASFGKNAISEDAIACDWVENGLARVVLTGTQLAAAKINVILRFGDF